MVVYLDANVVIYFVEQPPVWGPRSAARMAALRAGGETFAISDPTRMECQVGPLISGHPTLLADFNAFFTAPDVQVLTMSAPVFDRAARIRASYGFRTPDALHLAVAVESGCGLFLTNDARLNRFPDIPIEVLP